MQGTTRLTDYVLADPLGQGGMATVYRATYRPTGEVVALKRMLPHIASNEVFVARFVRELETSSKLRHHNVVRVQGYGCDDDGTWFLALEYCDGGTLVELLKRAPRLPPDVVVLMLDDLLAGLEEAHANDVVHRDIKPPNVLLKKSGRMLLTDFGIARSAADETLTATGEVIGTPAYMSPEQAQGVRDLDGRSDLFSVGMLAYRLLVGSNPFASENVATSILRVTTGPSLKVGDALSTVPPLLELVIDGLVEKNRDRRLASAADGRRLLAPLVAAANGRFPGLMRSMVTTPEATVREVVAATTAQEVEAARRFLVDKPARAMVHAARARAMSPNDAAVDALVSELTTLHGFRLDTKGADPRINLAEQELETKPDDPVVLRRLANLHRGLNSPLEAARYLKRYISLRPDDAMAQQQLAELVGADDVAVFTGVARAQPRLSTTGIMKGIKTGGAAAGDAPPVDNGRTQAWQPPEADANRPRPQRIGTNTTFGAPAVIAVHSEGTSVFTWIFRLLGIAAVVGVIAVVGSTVKFVLTPPPKPQANAVPQLEQTLGGLIDGTQQPFLQKASAAARIADWQGVIDATNFGLSADPERNSRVTPRLLMFRSEAFEMLGEPKQALADARLARGLFPDGPERVAANTRVVMLEARRALPNPAPLSPSPSPSPVVAPDLGAPRGEETGRLDEPLLAPTPTSPPGAFGSPNPFGGTP